MTINSEVYDFSTPWEKEKIPIVLIHGLGASTGMWYPQISAFSQHFPVIVVDLPGCGKSPEPEEGYSIELFAKAVNEEVKRLGYKKANILGISLGGFVAVEYAAKYSEETEKLVIVSTPYGFSDELTKLSYKLIDEYKNISVRKIASDRIDRAFGSLASRELKEFTIEHLSLTKHSVYINYAQCPLKYDFITNLKKIKNKSLIITGEMDYLATPDSSKQMCNDMNDAEVVILEKTGHASSLENPEPINEKVISFIKNS